MHRSDAGVVGENLKGRFEAMMSDEAVVVGFGDTVFRHDETG